MHALPRKYTPPTTKEEVDFASSFGLASSSVNMLEGRMDGRTAASTDDSYSVACTVQRTFHPLLSRLCLCLPGWVSVQHAMKGVQERGGGMGGYVEDAPRA
jgi:hypothetical protein